MPDTEQGMPVNQSVVKAISLLRAIAAERDGLNVSALARGNGIPRATALRLIHTLETEGFVLRTPGDDRVLLGPELLRLARGRDVTSLVRDIARPVIEDAAEAIRETVTLSVVAPDGGLDLVDQVDAPHQLRPRVWVGQRFPLHVSASGKILLAAMDDEARREALGAPLERYTAASITDPLALEHELERVRADNWAVARDEEEEGLTGVGVGVRSSSGDLLAVVTCGGPTQRLDRLRGQEALVHLIRAAEAIETTLHRRA